jgi:hypothetical protein
MTPSLSLIFMSKSGRYARVDTARTAAAVLAGLACLSLATGCSSTSASSAMPTEKHGMPTVLGPLTGSGSKAFTVTIRQGMAIELGCLGQSKGWAWARSPIAAFAIPCGNSGDVPYGSSYVAAKDLKLANFMPGKQVTVRVTAPAGDSWQLWITGGAV